MRNNDTTITFINTSKLTSNRPYQREIKERRVKELVAKWDPVQVNPIKVSDIDGTGELVVWDGQHTMAAMLMRNGNKDLDVPCLVSIMSEEETARAVAEQYNLRNKHNSAELFNIRVEANDPDAVIIKKILDEHGLRINRKASENSISSSIIIERIYQLGRYELNAVLRVATEAWENDKDRLKNEILEGLGYFVRVYQGEFDLNRLIRKLGEEKACFYIKEARARESGPLSHRVAVEFARKYNNKLKMNRLDLDKAL